MDHMTALDEAMKFPEECNCHSKPEKEKCKVDIVDSIALTEAALANILNAEGEKLQKAVKLSCSPEELLKINKSVQTTLTHVTFLEQTLFAKLETFCNDCYCGKKCKD